MHKSSSRHSLSKSLWAIGSTLLTLAQFAAIAIAVGAVGSLRQEESTIGTITLWGAAILFGIAVLIAYAAGVDLWNLRVIRRSLGTGPRCNGQVCVFSGRVRVLDSGSLTSALTRTPCAAYRARCRGLRIQGLRIHRGPTGNAMQIVDSRRPTSLPHVPTRDP